EADDAVQDAWLRLSRRDASEIENLAGWLTTVVARVSLNILRARKSRREEPVGPHVPDPIIDRADGTDPEHEALLADSVGLARRLARGLGGPRVARRARAAQPGRAARVRAARHVLGAICADRIDRRSIPRGDPPARQPRPPARVGRDAPTRRRSGHAMADRER